MSSADLIWDRVFYPWIILKIPVSDFYENVRKSTDSYINNAVS